MGQWSLNSLTSGTIGIGRPTAGIFQLVGNFSNTFYLLFKPGVLGIIRMQDRPYMETDEPNPVNTYGKSKLAGERLLFESGRRHCIMRVEWTYGLHGRNFVTKLIERAKEDEKLRIVGDQIGSPTATTEVAKAICELLPQRPEGIFHFASTGSVSRYEMARFICDKLGMSVDLSSCKSTDLTAAAARPLNSRFDCSKIQALLDEPIERWEGPLERFLERL